MGSDNSEGAVARRRAVMGAVALMTVAALGALLALASIAAGLDARALEVFMRDLGVWGPVAIVALMVLHCFVPFPAELVALGAGALFGVAMGSALVWVGAMLGAALSFALARKLGRPFVAAMLSEKGLAKLDDWTERQGTVSLLAARLAPVVAFNLVNYAAGLTAVRWTVFLWTTAVGIIPITVICAAFGASMRALDWRVTALLLAAAALTLAAGWALARRRR